MALQVAEQISAYLMTGEITNALNFPSISAEEAPRLTPFVKLAEVLGSFAGQLTETPIKGIRIEFEGDVAQLNTKPMMAAALAGVLKPRCGDVNMVSAPQIAKDRGIHVETINREQQGAYENYIRLTVITDKQERARRRHGVRQRQAAHHPGQGHQHGGGADALDALCHQRGQAGPYRPARHAAGQRSASTSPTSISAAPRLAATPSRCCRSTAL